MKKILFAASTVVMCFLISCKDAGSDSNSQNEKNLANNKEIYKAIETGDVSKIKDYIDKDAVDHSGPGGQEMKGGDSIVAMLGSIHNSFTDLKLEVIADATNGDYVFTLVRLTGTTAAKPGMGMPPNKKMDSKSVDVVKIKDGRATDHWEFDDPKEIMEMMQMEKGMPPMDTTKMSGKMDSSKMK